MPKRSVSAQISSRVTQTYPSVPVQQRPQPVHAKRSPSPYHEPLRWLEPAPWSEPLACPDPRSPDDPFPLMGVDSTVFAAGTKASGTGTGTGQAPDDCGQP